MKSDDQKYDEEKYARFQQWQDDMSDPQSQTVYDEKEAQEFSSILDSIHYEFFKHPFLYEGLTDEQVKDWDKAYFGIYEKEENVELLDEAYFDFEGDDSPW